MTTLQKAPTWFWIVSVVALLWNLLGVMAYLARVFMSPEALAALPEAERMLQETTPAWATAAFAFAVWGGTLGSVLLLLRKEWALPVLLVSLAGIVVQLTHSLFFSKALEVYGPGGLAMPIMILLFAIFLVWFVRKAQATGWIS
jgi:hypothetical protein